MNENLIANVGLLAVGLNGEEDIVTVNERLLSTRFRRNHAEEQQRQ